MNKRCPFCGSDSIYTAELSFGFHCTCAQCESRGPVKHTPKEAMKAWNRRTKLVAPRPPRYDDVYRDGVKWLNEEG